MRCACCDRVFEGDGLEICPECLKGLQLGGNPNRDNLLSLFLCGRIKYRYAASLAAYEPQNHLSELLRMAKYGNRPRINSCLTRLLVERCNPAHWPGDIDAIIPIPIHWRRLLRRGYNQVTPIADTLSEMWHVPVWNDVLLRRHFAASQVGHTWQDRYDHQRASLRVSHIDRLQGRHLLLVDDICTTGATLLAAAERLLEVPGVQVSFITLGKAI